MHIRDFDLNLLHVFRAVHAARNVSRAAEALGLSQPAVSHALTRLRLALHDPLFTRTTGGVAATPRAERFAQQIEAAFRGLDLALGEADAFDPAHSQRRFAVHMSDIGADEFLPQIMATVGREAPGVRIETVQLEPDQIGPALDQGRLDLAFGYLPGLSGTETMHLLDERYVVLLRRGHPLAATLRRREALQQLDFILVRTHLEPGRALHLLGLEARIRLTLPHFSVVPAILETTDLAVVLPLRPALRYANRRALQVVEPNLGLPPFVVSAHWTWRHQHDAGHAWLRDVVSRMRFGPVGAKRGATVPLRPRAASASAAAASRTPARSGR